MLGSLEEGTAKGFKAHRLKSIATTMGAAFLCVTILLALAMPQVPFAAHHKMTLQDNTTHNKCTLQA